ncbi:hypothetical protein D3C85_939970 [compost metagenome]
MLLGYRHAVVAQRKARGQRTIVVQVQFQGRAVLELHPARCARAEEGAQAQRLAGIHGQQGSQAVAVVSLEQLGKAGFHLGVVAGWMPEASQHPAQHHGLYPLRAAVGVDPIHRQPRLLGQQVQSLITHGAAPLQKVGSG